MVPSHLCKSSGHVALFPVQNSGKSHSSVFRTGRHSVPARFQLHFCTVFECLRDIPTNQGPNSNQTFRSQHDPTAQSASVFFRQVAGSQQGLSQNSGDPQSHSSPGSTFMFPQLLGLFRRHLYLFMADRMFSRLQELQNLVGFLSMTSVMMHLDSWQVQWPLS